VREEPFAIVVARELLEEPERLLGESFERLGHDYRKAAHDKKCEPRIYTPAMERNDVIQVMQDLERSIQMRQALLDRLARNEEVDLAQEWDTIEQLEMELSRKIRKRPVG
jgi:hypothetical protein